MQETESTPYYYAGSECSIVAFFVREDGIQLSVTKFKPDEDGAAVPDQDMAVVLSWKEFAELASEAAQICAARVGEE